MSPQLLPYNVAVLDPERGAYRLVCQSDTPRTAYQAYSQHRRRLGGARHPDNPVIIDDSGRRIVVQTQGRGRGTRYVVNCWQDTFDEDATEHPPVYVDPRRPPKKIEAAMTCVGCDEEAGLEPNAPLAGTTAPAEQTAVDDLARTNGASPMAVATTRATGPTPAGCLCATARPSGTSRTSRRGSWPR